MKVKKEIPIDWWRYPVAILVFIVAYFLLPIVAGLILTITNWFSPEYYKSSEMWIYILADVASAVVGFLWVEKLLENKKYVFQAVWAAIVAIYSFVVAVINRIAGITNLKQFLGVLAMGVVSIVYVGISCKKAKSEK